MKIVMNGGLGSGKSTVAKIIANRLGYEYVSTGTVFRQMAKVAGVDVVEFSGMAEQDPSIDEKIDTWVKTLNDRDENLIIDSRMAPYFVNDALKVRLNVDERIGASRIFADELRGNEERFESINEALTAYRIRKNSEDKRYVDAYGIDASDESIFHIIIDTSDKSADEVADTIINMVNKK